MTIRIEFSACDACGQPAPPDEVLCCPCKRGYHRAKVRYWIDVYHRSVTDPDQNHYDRARYLGMAASHLATLGHLRLGQGLAAYELAAEQRKRAAS